MEDQPVNLKHPRIFVSAVLLGRSLLHRSFVLLLLFVEFYDFVLGSWLGQLAVFAGCGWSFCELLLEGLGMLILFDLTGCEFVGLSSI